MTKRNLAGILMIVIPCSLAVFFHFTAKQNTDLELISTYVFYMLCLLAVVFWILVSLFLIFSPSGNGKNKIKKIPKKG